MCEGECFSALECDVMDEFFLCEGFEDVDDDAVDVSFLEEVGEISSETKGFGEGLVEEEGGEGVEEDE